MTQVAFTIQYIAVFRIVRLDKNNKTTRHNNKSLEITTQGITHSDRDVT